MRPIRGPGIFLALFISSEAPFDTFDGLVSDRACDDFAAAGVGAARVKAVLGLGNGR